MIQTNKFEDLNGRFASLGPGWHINTILRTGGGLYSKNYIGEHKAAGFFDIKISKIVQEKKIEIKYIFKETHIYILKNRNSIYVPF